MSKPVTNYLILNVIVITFLLCFFIAVGQGNNTSTTKEEPKTELSTLTPTELKKKEDSLVKVFSKEYNITVDKLNELPARKQEYFKLRKEEQNAYEDLSKALNTLFQQTGRNEKVVSKNIKQKLREGELVLVKDSICIESKKKFLSRKTICKKWEYHFYLQNSNGKLEKLW